MIKVQNKFHVMDKEEKIMKKSTYLFSLVSSLLVLGLVEAVSGFILWFALPSGGGRKGLELTYLGIARHTWIDIHDWIAIALTVIVIIHIVIHWKWVLQMGKNIFRLATETTKTDVNSSKMSI
jgi:uncharacterized iron-regulated membrane protein